METKRDYSLDVIKIVATIIIIFHHYQQVTGVTFNGINFFGGQFYFGYVVELFFVLSGFFMYSYIQKIKEGTSFKNFYLRRFIRLFPLMAISAVSYEIFLTIYYKLYQNLYSWFGISTSFWGTIIASLGIQEGWALPNPCVNNPTWYISVLLLCYIVFYIAVYFSKKYDIPVEYIFIFMIFLGMGICTYGINLPFLNAQSARGYYAFFFGVILAGLLRKYNISTKLQIFCGMILIAIPLLIIYQNDLMSNGINYIMTFIYYPALIIVFKSPIISRIFNRKWIGTLGKISFDVYIWHNPFYLLMYILMKVFDWNLNLNSCYTMMGYALVCYAFGAVSYFAIEKPINNIINKKFFTGKSEKCVTYSD